MWTIKDVSKKFGILVCMHALRSRVMVRECAEFRRRRVLCFAGVGDSHVIVARMRVPKMVKNGVKCVFACLCSLWICLMSVFWLCLGNKNRFIVKKAVF